MFFWKKIYLYTIMKKVICFQLLIIGTITITACKKNGNDSANKSNKSIVGTWELTHYNEVDVDSTTNPITINVSDSNLVHGNAQILKFNSDNSCSAQPYENSLNVVPGAYSLIGIDTISFSFGPGPPQQKPKYTIQGITLTFSYPPHYLYDSLHFFLRTETYMRLL